MMSQKTTLPAPGENQLASVDLHTYQFTVRVTLLWTGDKSLSPEIEDDLGTSRHGI